MKLGCLKSFNDSPLPWDKTQHLSRDWLARAPHDLSRREADYVVTPPWGGPHPACKTLTISLSSPSSLIRFQANSSCAGLLSYDSSNPGPLHSFPLLWQIPPSSLYLSALYSFSSSLLCHFSRSSLSLTSLNQSGSSQNLETMMRVCVCVCGC